LYVAAPFTSGHETSIDFAVDAVADVATPDGVTSFGICVVEAITIAVDVGITNLLFESVATWSMVVMKAETEQLVRWGISPPACTTCPELVGETTAKLIPLHPWFIIQMSPLGATAAR
jgi:hypothetical protein